MRCARLESQFVRAVFDELKQRPALAGALDFIAIRYDPIGLAEPFIVGKKAVRLRIELKSERPIGPNGIAQLIAHGLVRRITKDGFDNQVGRPFGEHVTNRQLRFLLSAIGVHFQCDGPSAGWLRWQGPSGLAVNR